jgi:hypothetical protein
MSARHVAKFKGSPNTQTCAGGTTASSPLSIIWPAIAILEPVGRNFLLPASNITLMEMTLSVPVTGDIGDQPPVKVDKLGDLQGLVAKRTRTGFVLAISATEPERARLKVKIDWFEQIRARKVVNKRLHNRFAPINPHSTLIFADGSTLQCFVMDMSSSGGGRLG